MEVANVLEWLLDSDPSIRWQVMRDLTGESSETVAAERSKVAAEGWGAKLLALQDAYGQWGTNVVPPPLATGELPDVTNRKLLRDLHAFSLEGMADFLGVEPAHLSAWEEGRPAPEEGIEGYRNALEWMRNSLGTYSPRWISTTFTLLLLRDMGLPPASAEARRAVGLVRENSKWEEGGQDYFDGEVEPCINGMAVAIGAYFGENVDGIVDRLLGEQLGDGGWNCEAERGSTRASFDTTISVLEGLLEYERAQGGSSGVAEVRHAGEEYLLERRLMRRLSTGEIINPSWLQFSYPPRWHYDVLRGLDYLRSAGLEADERSDEAIDLVEKKRQPDGRWLLENTYPGRVHFEMDEGDGKPSRWNTLRGMRVLAWAGRDS